MGSTTATPYDGSNYAVGYSIPSVTAGSSTIATGVLNTIATAVNGERTRRGTSTVNITIPSGNTKVTVDTLNACISGLTTIPGLTLSTPRSGSPPTYSNQSPYTAGPFTSATKGAKITAKNLNDMITTVVNAGNQCLCNCNYCTCNCNYCTCNCNYACTCNCNYSDERLKENIEHVGFEHGLNMYTWNYIWDKTTRYMGVMAQEVLNTNFSHAVSQAADGYYQVDYTRLPVNMTQVR